MPTPATTNLRHHLYFWGHLAKGLVFIATGGLALATVIGQASGGPEGPQQIARFLQAQTGGQILLILLAVGLFAYCGWRWYKAVTDEGGEGRDAEGLAARTGYAISGTLYGLLGVYCITLLGSGGAEGNKRSILSSIMQAPGGRFLVAALAAAACYAAYRQYRKVSDETYMNELDTERMNPKERKTYRWMGKLGFGSRIVVYILLAYFLVRAALTEDASRYEGLGGILKTISQGAGSIFLALVSLGLFLYGAFVLVKARYREFS
jgi:hypothetical protein